MRLGNQRWAATVRVLDADKDDVLDAEVRELARKKYGWGEGLPVEFRLDRRSPESVALPYPIRN